MSPATTTTDRQAPDHAPAEQTVDVIRVGGVPIETVVTAVRDASLRVTLILVGAIVVVGGVATWVICAHLSTANGWLLDINAAIREEPK